MEVLYNSTRNNKIQVKASEAILKGLSDDGGLFVPDHIPALPKSLKELSGMTYQEVAYEIMSLYLTDFTEEELKICIANAYDSKFDTAEIAPLVQADGAYFLELFHGATIAFKDMALSILPHLMIASARKNKVKNEIVILTATSGDTGKAALAGFAGVEGTRIIVFYPKSGVSPIQERQMVTQKGENTYVVGIHGNFDDAQSGVKRLFADKELAERMDRQGYQFSSANSINIGRLIPQSHSDASRRTEYKALLCGLICVGIGLQAFHIPVNHKEFRKSRLLKEGQGQVVAAHLRVHVGVASDHNGNLVLLTEL